MRLRLRPEPEPEPAIRSKGMGGGGWIGLSIFVDDEMDGEEMYEADKTKSSEFEKTENRL